MPDDFQNVEALAMPIEKTLFADEAKPIVLVVRANAQQVVVVFKKGYTDGEGFHEVFSDSYIFEDTVDEQGAPTKTEYSDLMQDHTICQWCQGKDVPNAQVLRQLAIFYLKQVGAI